jgi:hypothetical protein
MTAARHRLDQGQRCAADLGNIKDGARTFQITSVGEHVDVSKRKIDFVLQCSIPELIEIWCNCVADTSLSDVSL